MTEQELTNILKDMYINAQNGEKVSSIHLFGIEYAEDLINKDIKKIAIEATGNESYQTEIAKGKKLASLLKNKQLLKTNSSKIIFESSKLKTKNIMLYGAPGVGKTHNYKRLITMIENGESEKTIFSTISKNETTNDFDNSIFEMIKNEKRIEFVTFHQSYSYEDFIEGFRPNEEGKLELEDGIFKKISQNAEEQVNEVEKNQISYDEAYNTLRSKYIDNTNSDLKTVSGKNILISNFEDKFIQVKSEDGRNWFNVKKNDLEVVVNEILKQNIIKPSDIKLIDVKKDTIALAGYYFPIGNALAEIIKESKVNTKEQKNFYIVIDEINRGNISKIFGELITLIEEDKRGKEEYKVKLPYSKKTFVVPSNLYIIATMNSTDKSIATIDIALRRRFTFLKMKPNPKLVQNDNARQLMKELNQYISKSFLGEDYQLGHSYFIGDDIDIEFIKDYKIKPLLEEYFYSEAITPDEIIKKAKSEYKEEVIKSSDIENKENQND
ncbi:AAA family ATPase [Arcobacter lacus]|uniref:McrB family protein n=1 Tax=Arcobacter lacus TaxID=1912876 RepID=UPI0021BA66F2|nr:AAA family ATPase [Arcobacter lacus]MCT7908682.1 AAA family ATPase [Arcobacter lacus]